MKIVDLGLNPNKPKWDLLLQLERYQQGSSKKYLADINAAITSLKSIERALRGEA